MIRTESHSIDISESTQEESSSERNRRVLYETGKNLLPKFLTDYSSKLPDAIVLPDTSARPLFYLLRPILEKVADKRDVSIPRTYFFAAVLLSHLDNLYVSGETAEEKANRMCFDRGVWSERAWQITESLRRLGINQPEIVIFDDHISAKARTSGEINLAFGRVMPLYVFTSELEEEVHESLGRKVKIGGLENIQLSTWDYFGIGVTKNDRKTELFVKKANYFHRKIVSEFRNEMSEIGRKLAEELVT